MKDFSRIGPLQAVTYTVKVILSNIWCKIDTLILQITNGKYHMAYRFVKFPMTLDDLAGPSPVAGLIISPATGEGPARSSKVIGNGTNR